MALGQAFVIFCVSSRVWAAPLTKLSEMQKKCYDGDRFKNDGAKFHHFFSDSPCEFECTCIFRKTEGAWQPTGSCSRRCPVLEIPPYGCEQISDGCCATSYNCPQGEKCQDRETGLQYIVGTTWKRAEKDSTCNCTCYGESEGKYQCKCGPAGEDSRQKLDDQPAEVVKPSIECNMDDSEPCRACPVGMNTCPIRAKCERWKYLFEGINLECTCYGKEGTRCVSRKHEEDNTREENTGAARDSHRAKRSTSHLGDDVVVKIYFSEGVRQTIESTVMQITREIKLTFNDDFLS